MPIRPATIRAATAATITAALLATSASFAQTTPKHPPKVTPNYPPEVTIPPDTTGSEANPRPPAMAPFAISRGQLARTKLQEKLEGEWKDANSPKSPLRIRFYRTAGGTTLVEEWRAGDKPHSLTLYGVSGETLLATHYCPQGNQPRLALVKSDKPNTIAFTFKDATDLDAQESHLHDLSFDLSDPTRIIRTETYRQGDKNETTKLVLVR